MRICTSSSASAISSTPSGKGFPPPLPSPHRDKPGGGVPSSEPALNPIRTGSSSYRPWLSVVSACVLALPWLVQAQPGDDAVLWDVRRLRTSDADTAGGYPDWTVSQTAGPEGLDITVAERGSEVRGQILLGRVLSVPADKLMRLQFSYTSTCALDHRSGQLELCIFDRDTWERMPTDARAGQLNGADELRPRWRWTIHSMSEPDVTEPMPLNPDASNALAQALRPYAGRSMVVALSWLGAHNAVESASIRGLRMEESPVMSHTKMVIDSLDLTRPELRGVAAAAAEGDYDAAMLTLLEHFRRRWPDPPEASAIHKSTEDADQALENRFRSIGSPTYYRLREDFDWDRNAISDKEWLLHLQWHDILVTLVTAGSVTGDVRYTAKAADLIRDWIPRNYPGAPWSWRTLEVSLRAMKWSRIYPYLLHYDGFTPEDHAAFLHTLEAHVNYLLPEERFHSGHNFGATECKALLRVGLDFPEFENAETWRQTAWTRIEGEMTDQVLPDGAQRELTCGYHNGVTRTFFSAAQWVEGTDLEPSEHYWSQLEKMYEYTAYLTKPDGSQPNVGDTWSNQQGALVEQGGAYFERPDLVFIGSHGARGARPTYLDRELPAAGYYAMRTSWPDDPDGIYLFLDAANLWGGWHSHYDALGIILYAHGRTLTPDAGPFAYGNPLRDVFQSTAAHSTVCVDESNQNPEGCRTHAFISDPRLTFADAEQSGYEGVTHRRQILFVRPDHGMPPYFVVVDRLMGTGEHQLDQRFHLPVGDVETDADTMTVRTVAPDTGNLEIQAVRTAGVTMTSATSWIMTGYGQKTDRPEVCYSQTTSLPALFVTLLVPFRGDRRPSLNAEMLPGSSADGALALSVQDGTGTEDTLFVGTTAAGGEIADLSWQGRAGLRRRDAAGRTVCRVLVGEQ